MCCLFGLLDYNNVFSAKEKNKILLILSTECEARGIDSTGIAYNANNRLRVYKKALPAHQLRYAIPKHIKYIMGHTRMTTQGSEKRNYNNHPFLGSIPSGKFALAHNGMIHNDIQLRKSESLPHTKIQTDSFIAVQLIEKQRTLNFESLAKMAEKVEGSFTFTVIDNRDNLYIIKGNNPFCLFHFPNQGFYLYASTNEILMKAIAKLDMLDIQKVSIFLSYGDILKIDKHGKTECESFDVSGFFDKWYFSKQASYHNNFEPNTDVNDDSYLQNLKTVVSYYGYSSNEVDILLAEGFTYEEIEELLCVSYF